MSCNKTGQLFSILSKKVLTKLPVFWLLTDDMKIVHCEANFFQ